MPLRRERRGWVLVSTGRARRRPSGRQSTPGQSGSGGCPLVRSVPRCAQREQRETRIICRARVEPLGTEWRDVKRHRHKHFVYPVHTRVPCTLAWCVCCALPTARNAARSRPLLRCAAMHTATTQTTTSSRRRRPARARARVLGTPIGRALVPRKKAFVQLVWPPPLLMPVKMENCACMDGGCMDGRRTRLSLSLSRSLAKGGDGLSLLLLACFACCAQHAQHLYHLFVACLFINTDGPTSMPAVLLQHLFYIHPSLIHIDIFIVTLYERHRRLSLCAPLRLVWQYFTRAPARPLLAGDRLLSMRRIQHFPPHPLVSAVILHPASHPSSDCGVKGQPLSAWRTTV